ncbi:MAG: acetyl-CoA C-acetyltransferase [Gammaproteobacteria bacterium]
MTKHIKDAYIVAATRTPVGKAPRGVFRNTRPDEMLAHVLKAVVAQAPGIDVNRIDDAIIGCAMPEGEQGMNVARIGALLAGLPNTVAAQTINRFCSSGLQAVALAADQIRLGNADLVLAGGTESMSHAPVLFDLPMVGWLGELNGSKNAWSRIKALGRFRPSYLKPVIGLLRGLTDPVVGLSMGQTAEELAYRFGITREAMDEYAVQSHKRLAAAQFHGQLAEVETVYDWQGNHYTRDDGVRPDSTTESLSHLKPVFDREFGQVTSGNSAQVTDGAACLILASGDAVQRHKLPILGRIVDVQWAALDPRQMGLGPVYASAPLLQRYRLSLENIDYWEINEAFAAQVLACLHFWRDKDCCRTELGLDKALGEIERGRLNVDGGGISLGHPVGASGARIVLHLLHVLARTGGTRGIATLCVGGGQGGAMLVERGG